MAGNDVVDARMCPQCKREFIVPMGGRESYVYKLRNSKKGTTEYYCSWTCYKMAKSKEIHSKKKRTAEEQNWLKWVKGK